MDDKAIIAQLEELAQRVGITVRYEPLKTEGFIHTGGFCRIKGKDFVIINKKATGRERMHILIDSLKRYDLSQIYILPSLREILDGEKGR
jgi:selenocysteine lyase/cysteine desulfurase